MKPILQALVLAERVYEDADTGQKIIAGTFNAILISPRSSSDTPQVVETDDGKQRQLVAAGKPGAPWAYISLTDVCDGTVIDLQFISLTRNKVLFGTQISLNSADRLASIEIVIPLPALNVAEPGTYAFEIVCEGEIVGSHRILAKIDEKEITK